MQGGFSLVKFIHCFSQELKDELLKNGYPLLYSDNNVSIFENTSTIKFNFSKADQKQFMFSNKMII
jgi:hypothetical protein